jgi:hypothetical protein
MHPPYRRGPPRRAPNLADEPIHPAINIGTDEELVPRADSTMFATVFIAAIPDVNANAACALSSSATCF